MNLEIFHYVVKVRSIRKQCLLGLLVSFVFIAIVNVGFGQVGCDSIKLAKIDIEESPYKDSVYVAVQKGRDFEILRYNYWENPRSVEKRISNSTFQESEYYKCPFDWTLKTKPFDNFECYPRYNTARIESRRGWPYDFHMDEVELLVFSKLINYEFKNSSIYLMSPIRHLNNDIEINYHPICYLYISISSNNDTKSITAIKQLYCPDSESIYYLYSSDSSTLKRNVFEKGTQVNAVNRQYALGKGFPIYFYKPHEGIIASNYKNFLTTKLTNISRADRKRLRYVQKKVGFKNKELFRLGVW